MKSIPITLLLIAFALPAPSTAGERARLETVPAVDLDRYLGRWYEIASYPAWFQRGCTASTAEYSRRPDGAIRVVNRCRKGALGGKPKVAEGKAVVVDPIRNAKLEVSFFWPFSGDYWIIDLDQEYGWAVVGEPRRNYLWILSRTPTMDEATYQAIVSRLPDKGYDPGKLRRTLQPTEVRP